MQVYLLIISGFGSMRQLLQITVHPSGEILVADLGLLLALALEQDLPSAELNLRHELPETCEMSGNECTTGDECVCECEW